MMTARKMAQTGLFVAVALVASLPAAASSDSEWPPKSIDQLPVISEKEGEKDAKGLVVKIHSLERTSNDLAILTWSITNDGGSNKGVTGIFNNEDYAYASERELSSVSLVDKKEGVEYQPIMDSGKNCVCTEMENDNHPQSLSKGASFSSYSSYFIREKTEKVSVKVRGFPEFENVQVK